MELNASGLLLAQYTALDALSNSVIVADSSLQIEVTRIIICNTSASPVAASLFQDDSGAASFTTATALMFGKLVPANDYIEVLTQGPNGGFHLKKGGAIGFTDASSGDLTLNIYGISQPVQGSGRGR